MAFSSWQRALRWLLPSVCAGCGNDVDGRSAVCSRCALSLQIPHAAPRPAMIDRFHAVAGFESPLRELVLAFKYRGRAYLGEELASWMAFRAPAWVGECSFIAPVPAPWLRQVARGYHPAEVLATALARQRNVSVQRLALRRRHGFPSQTSLGRGARRQNADDSFAAGFRRGPVAGQRVLLVDDVCTTGATLTACARLLRASGAIGVDALVLAQEALGANS